MEIKNLVKETYQDILLNWKVMATAYLMVALLDVAVSVCSLYFVTGETTNGSPIPPPTYLVIGFLGLFLLKFYAYFLIYSNVVHFSSNGTPTNLYTFKRPDLTRRTIYYFTGISIMTFLAIGIGSMFFTMGIAFGYYQRDFLDEIVAWFFLILSLGSGGLLIGYFLTKYSVVMPMAVLEKGKIWTPAIDLTKGFRWKIAGFKGLVVLSLILLILLSTIPLFFVNGFSDGVYTAVNIFMGCLVSFGLFIIWTTADIVLLRSLRKEKDISSLIEKEKEN